MSYGSYTVIYINFGKLPNSNSLVVDRYREHFPQPTCNITHSAKNIIYQGVCESLWKILLFDSFSVWPSVYMDMDIKLTARENFGSGFEKVELIDIH